MGLDCDDYFVGWSGWCGSARIRTTLDLVSVLRTYCSDWTAEQLVLRLVGTRMLVLMRLVGTWLRLAPAPQESELGDGPMAHDVFLP